MGRLLENAPLDAKIEICIEALTSITKQLVVNQRREEQLLDRLEAVLKRIEVESLALAIREEIARRDRMDLTKAKGQRLWKNKRKSSF